MSDHDYAIFDVLVELLNKEYECYPEFEIFLNEGKDRTRVVVDIYAVKGQKEILVEVGHLSLQRPDRLQLLKTLKPNAKVIHVTQWKNYITRFDFEDLRFLEWKRLNEEDDTIV